MNTPVQLSEFITMLNREYTGSSVEIDAPRDPNG